MTSTFKQEMPPKGGYGPVDYKRAMPKRGPSGYLLLGGVTSCVMFGMVCWTYGNRKRRAWQRESREARIALWPLLEAERDRDILKVLKHNYEQEAIIMKDVPGWQAGLSPYNTKRWVEPHVENLYYLNEAERHQKKHGYAYYV